MPVMSRPLHTTVVAFLMIAVLLTAMAGATPLTRAGADLVRQAAEVGLRAPRPLDVRRFEGADIGPMRRPPRIDEGALLRFLRGADENLARAVENADPALRRTTLEALAGARAIERAIPANPMRRAEIVERGGVDLLRAAAQPVDGLGDALILLDGSIRAGRLPDTAFARFGQALDAQGDAFAIVWREHIAPNWEVVVAGGLVVAFLAEPERFIDTAGRLTSHAVAAFSELGIEVGASIAEGVLRGTWRSVERRLEQSLGWTLLALAMFLVAGWVFVARRLRTRKKTGRRP